MNRNMALTVVIIGFVLLSCTVPNTDQCADILSNAHATEKQSLSTEKSSIVAPFEEGRSLDDQLEALAQNATISQKVLQLVREWPIRKKIQNLSDETFKVYGLSRADIDPALYDMIAGTLHVREPIFDKEWDPDVEMAPTLNVDVLRRGSFSVLLPSRQIMARALKDTPYTAEDYEGLIKRGLARFEKSTGMTVDVRSEVAATADYGVTFIASDLPALQRTPARFNRIHSDDKRNLMWDTAIGHYIKIPWGAIVFQPFPPLESVLPRFQGVHPLIQKREFLAMIELATEHEMKHAIAFGGTIHHQFVLGHSWSPKSRMFPSIQPSFHVIPSSAMMPYALPLFSCATETIVSHPFTDYDSDPSGKAIRLYRALLSEK